MALAVGLLCAAGGALAQPKVTSGLDPSGEPYSNRYYLTMPSKVGVLLLRSAELGDGNFVIRLSMMDQRSSCADAGPLNTEHKFDNMYLDITVASYVVDMRNAPAHPGQCDRAPQTPYADILLNRDEMRGRGIKKVRFHYMNFTDTFDVEYGTHSIKLGKAAAMPARKNVANAYVPHAAYGIGTPLELWFLPENTIALYAPAVPQGLDANAEIEALAKGRGLLPVTQSVPDFVPARTTPQIYYFTDPQNMYLKKLARGSAEVFAQLRVPKTVYGLHGDSIAYDYYDVYMKKPGLYE